MTDPQLSGEELWTDFLALWPLERLGRMTLLEYTQAGDPDCFSYGWLEQRTEKLGSIWGGSAFKFGVYSRKDKSPKASGGGRSYSSDYGWYSKYGDSPEYAFLRVRAIISQVAHAAYAGDLETVRRADLGDAIKWKIAFVYQNREIPSVLPIYSAEHLAAFLEQKSKRNIAALHEAAMARRGGQSLLEYGKEIWGIAQGRLDAMTLTPQDALAYFQENPDRFPPTTEPNKSIAGFSTSEGLNLALALDGKDTRLWLEPGGWLDDVKVRVKKIEHYPAERTRDANLDTAAPKIASGMPAVSLVVPNRAAFLTLLDAYELIEKSENVIMTTDSDSFSLDEIPLNQILYGPPGTGKTHSTINEALRILDPEYLRSNRANRKNLKDRFDALLLAGQLRFVTFHQSFSYEDFVEGLRATTNDDKQPEYVIEPGVFKRLCDDARTHGVQPDASIRANPRIWKISINGSGASATKTYCLNHGEARIGWGDTGDLRNVERNDYYRNGIGPGDQSTLAYFSQEIQPGDIMLVLRTADTFEAVGVVTGIYDFEDQVPAGIIDGYRHVLPVNWIYRDIDVSILDLNDNKQFTPKTVYPLSRITWGDLTAYLEQVAAAPVQQSCVAVARKPHVLIIDEINRGNISRIFGELITLIEPSKRVGGDDALTTILPYSKKPFSVPGNVYLIGTMNTADRSLAGLDIALRRRFTFKEMPPKPELLDAMLLQGMSVGRMLRTMNERIEVLLDRDHCIGHAYFMQLGSMPSLEQFGRVFQFQIMPLLQEYFFEDWERIVWVLNDQNKSPEHAFVRRSSTNLSTLFGAEVADGLQNMDHCWRVNPKAFQQIASYQGIVGPAA